MNTKAARQFISKELIIITLFWAITQIALFIFFGVNPVLESIKYIRAAEGLLENGTLPEVRYFFYLSTTLLIAFCLKTGLGYIGVVILQLILNFVATIYFYKALKANQLKQYSALFTLLLLISFLPFQAWHYYLYTESVFYSFALLFFSSCLRFPLLTKKAFIAQASLLLLTIISRPLGILFLPCWMLFIARKKNINKSVLISSLLITAAIGIVVCNIIMSSISDWHILKPAEFGYIICDIPSGSRLALDHLKSNTPVVQLFLFVVNYPRTFLELCMIRLSYFITLTRSYYSSLHNWYLIFYAALFTLPVFINFFTYGKKMFTTANNLLSIMIILSFCSAVALQCDDYHNRFHHTIVPIFLYAGIFLLLEKNFFSQHA